MAFQQVSKKFSDHCITFEPAVKKQNKRLEWALKNERGRTETKKNYLKMKKTRFDYS